MIRIGVIISLLFSLFLLVKGGALTWSVPPLPEQNMVKEKKTPGGRRADLALDFYPPITLPMPDLTVGYLFNSARTLAEEGEEVADDNLDLPIITLEMEEVEYIGSMITDSFRKGMISFMEKEPLPTPETEQAATAARRRISRIAANRRTAAKSNKKIMTVDEGSDFKGYLVASVLPEKIVFERDGATLEKYLYDPEKERATPPPVAQPQRAPRAPSATTAPRTMPTPTARTGVPNLHQQQTTTATPSTATPQRPTVTNPTTQSRRSAVRSSTGQIRRPPQPATGGIRPRVIQRQR